MFTVFYFRTARSSARSTHVRSSTASTSTSTRPLASAVRSVAALASSSTSRGRRASSRTPSKSTTRRSRRTPALTAHAWFDACGFTRVRYLNYARFPMQEGTMVCERSVCPPITCPDQHYVIFDRSECCPRCERVRRKCKFKDETHKVSVWSVSRNFECDVIHCELVSGRQALDAGRVHGVLVQRRHSSLSSAAVSKRTLAVS